MRIGVVFPQTELGGDASAVRAYAQRAEELGFTHVLAYDHVVGADPAVHTGWDGPYDVRTTFHEPMVLYGYRCRVQRPIRSGSAPNRRAPGAAPGAAPGGWFPQMAPGPQLDQACRIVAEAAAEAGRDPASLGMEGHLRRGSAADECGRSGSQEVVARGRAGSFASAAEVAGAFRRVRASKRHALGNVRIRRLPIRRTAD